MSTDICSTRSGLVTITESHHNALINMVATMQQHFTYEEGCMKASKHDNYERHKQVRCLDILVNTVRYIHIIPLWLS